MGFKKVGIRIDMHSMAFLINLILSISGLGRLP